MDNHAHLPTSPEEIFVDETGYAMPLAEQLRLAEQVGVTRIVTSACTLPDWEPSLQLAAAWPNIRLAVAIHPNEAPLHAGIEAEAPDGNTYRREAHHIPLIEALEQVSVLARNEKVVAIGETGLDYFRTGEAGREAQQESFRVHLELARLHDLPLQIHDREAHQDTLQLLAEAASREQVIVFHSFSGDAQMARVLAAHGWYASFSGPLTYPKNQHLREALLALPKSHVLVETDAPYLPPQKYRGCPNASYSMTYTVRKIAELWQVPEAEACEILMANSRRVYGDW